VNSKATLRVSLKDLSSIVPTLLHSYIRNSRYYAAKTESLVIQADDDRSQNENVRSCFLRLHDLIIEAGKESVPGETSAAQREHVQKLQKADNERRLQSKKFSSSKKTSRRGGRGDE
jgi:peptidyl-tRNA hydrolase ICT1